MRILFDHQAFVMQTHGGVSRCFTELMKHFPNNCHAELSLLESNNAYALNAGLCKPVGYYFHHFPIHRWDMFDRWNRLRGRNGKDYWNTCKYDQLETINKLKKGKYDVFHPTYFNDYFLPYLNGKPFVLTIHDMIPEHYPQYYKQDYFQIRMKRKLAPLANAIIAVSETTKHDIIRFLNIPADKIHVIYHGCSFPQMTTEKAIVHSPYILYVGDRYGYKNFDLFLKYVTPFLKKHKDFHVVCTGKEFNPSEIQMMDDFGIRERCINQWVATDKEFFSLYHHAFCFIYPSDYEGFGIPILEAYKAGCPVLLHRASCFPEIAENAAIYFDMDSQESDMTEQLERLYSMSSKEKDKLLAKQEERLNFFSWKKSANQLVEVYKSVI